MAKLTYDLPDGNIAEYIEAYCALHPNTETTEPDEDGNTEAKYTDNQWVKEHLRRHIIKEIKRGKEVIARDAINVDEPEDITAE